MADVSKGGIPGAAAAVDSDAPVLKGTLLVRRLSYVVIDQDEYRTTSTDYVPLDDVAVAFINVGFADVVAAFSAAQPADWRRCGRPDDSTSASHSRAPLGAGTALRRRPCRASPRPSVPSRGAPGR